MKIVIPFNIGVVYIYIFFFKVTAHGMKFTAQLYVFKDQFENLIKVTELTALY